MLSSFFVWSKFVCTTSFFFLLFLSFRFQPRHLPASQMGKRHGAGAWLLAVLLLHLTLHGAGCETPQWEARLEAVNGSAGIFFILIFFFFFFFL